MSVIGRFRTIGEADKSRAVEDLIKSSTPDFDFFYLIMLSVLMATFGLLIDSVAIVIGSMLIAPMLSPILSLSLGMAMSDYKLIQRSLYTILKSSGYGIGSAILATLLFSAGNGEVTSEILSRTEPSLIYFVVAVVAGLAVSFSLVKPELSVTLPGVAVSVALIPPLAVVGVGVAMVDLDIISGSLLLFLINVVGIVFASMVSFSLMDVYGKRKVAATTIKKEEQRVEKENKKIEQIEEKDKAQI